MKKLYQFFCVTYCSFFLFSCSSTPPETNYFLLMNSVNKPNVSSLNNKQNIVLSIHLAEYLDKPYLAMQLNENQIHYSLFHLWAEPLKEGIAKALKFEFNNIEKNNDIIKVNVQVDYFHPTNTSTVVLVGAYQIKKGEKKINQPFYFEDQLNRDGFSHAVTKMRELLSQLSILINNSL